jgi:hypothetical protein
MTTHHPAPPPFPCLLLLVSLITGTAAWFALARLLHCAMGP